MTGEASTPAAATAALDLDDTVDNAPGLAALAYRVGTHGTILRRMLAQLPLQTIDDASGGHRPLARLTTRASGDPAIALLDAWATVGDVLTFYQERIANEGFLRTATERRSVLELARADRLRAEPGGRGVHPPRLPSDPSPGAPTRGRDHHRDQGPERPGPGPAAPDLRDECRSRRPRRAERAAAPPAPPAGARHRERIAAAAGGEHRRRCRRRHGGRDRHRSPRPHRVPAGGGHRRRRRGRHHLRRRHRDQPGARRRLAPGGAEGRRHHHHDPREDDRPGRGGTRTRSHARCSTPRSRPSQASPTWRSGPPRSASPPPPRTPPP